MGALDEQHTDVLPVLLQQRYQEVDGGGDVGQLEGERKIN